MVDDARSRLARLIDKHGVDYATLSRLLGRNSAYVQQYIKRGSPRRLAEQDRRTLAAFFGVDETLLGGPDSAAARSDFLAVPRLDIGASAGPGAFADEESAQGHIAFDPRWLRRLAAGDPGGLSLIRVSGDSMAPTLSDGDEILVDRGDGAARVRDGIYVLRVDELLMVKRLSLHPAARRVTVSSDNPAYPAWPDCDPAAIRIVGRVLWASGRVE